MCILGVSKIRRLHASATRSYTAHWAKVRYTYKPKNEVAPECHAKFVKKFNF